MYAPWARICKPLKEPWNQLPASWAVTTTLFDIPARRATKAGRIDSLELIPELLKCLQIRALLFKKGKLYVLTDRSFRGHVCRGDHFVMMYAPCFFRKESCMCWRTAPFAGMWAAVTILWWCTLRTLVFGKQSCIVCTNWPLLSRTRESRWPFCNDVRTLVFRKGSCMCWRTAPFAATWAAVTILWWCTLPGVDTARIWSLRGSRCLIYVWGSTMTIYGPMIFTAPYVMLLMRANPSRGQVGGGWALEIKTFLVPRKSHWAVRQASAIWGQKKSR